MKKLLCLALMSLSFASFAQENIDLRIERRLERLNDLVQRRVHTYLSQSEKAELLRSINQSILILKDDGTSPGPIPNPIPTPTPSGADLICTKGSNGLFYPTSERTFQIVGSTSYSAGYANISECQSLLPTRYDIVACMKQSNSLFYPVDLVNYSVLGSNSYSAGHASPMDCRNTLPQRNERLACFKQSNGLYYPTDASTGTVVGSNSYSAGYAGLQECVRTIRQR